MFRSTFPPMNSAVFGQGHFKLQPNFHVELPPEIWDQIIDSLLDVSDGLLAYLRDLRACSLVCRQWWPRSQRHQKRQTFEVDSVTFRLLFIAETSCAQPSKLILADDHQQPIEVTPEDFCEAEANETLVENREQIKKALDVLYETLSTPIPLEPRHKTLMQISMLWLTRVTGLVPTKLVIKHGIDNIPKSPIAGGAFADIFKAEYQGSPIAMKRICLFVKDIGEKRLRRFRAMYREAMIWRQLCCPHIVTLLGIYIESPGTVPLIHLILPWAEKGDFYDAVQTIHSDDIGYRTHLWLLEVSKGVEYLHNHGIIHGDIRGKNVLIDQNYHAQLTDFGLACFGEDCNRSLLTSHSWNPQWAAPELFQLKPEDDSLNAPWPDTCCDVFSFGCLCVEFYAQDSPYPKVTKVPQQFQLMLEIQNGKRPEPPVKMPLLIYELAEECWVPNGKERLQIHDVVTRLEYCF